MSAEEKSILCLVLGAGWGEESCLNLSAFIFRKKVVTSSLISHCGAFTFMAPPSFVSVEQQRAFCQMNEACVPIFMYDVVLLCLIWGVLRFVQFVLFCI